MTRTVFERIIGAKQTRSDFGKRTDVAIFIGYVVIAFAFVVSALSLTHRTQYQSPHELLASHDLAAWTWFVTFFIVGLCGIAAFVPSLRDAWDRALPSPMLGIVIAFLIAESALAVLTRTPNVFIGIALVEMLLIGTASFVRTRGSMKDDSQ